MQKIIAVIALVALLGVTSATLTNGSYATGPKEVANNTNDANILSADYIRFVSSGDNVLLQGVKDDVVSQKTISTKDLGASANTSYNQSGYDHNVKGVQAVAFDSVINANAVNDKNGNPQIQVIKYKLSSSGATNSTPQDITSFKVNTTILQLVTDSASIHPGPKKFYVGALLKDNATATAATLVVAGVDISGTGTTITTLSTTAPLDAQVSCEGIAGSKSLYCVWTHNASNIVGAKVDPNTNVSAADVRLVGTPGATVNIRAWSTSNSYGSLVITNGNVLEVQSNTNNWTTVKTELTAGSLTAGVFPRNDLTAVFYLTPVPTPSISVQYLDKNGAVNGTAVGLVTGVTQDTLLHQHSDGSFYVGERVPGNNVVVGQIWGSTHLAASTIQAAVYACIALVAALFVF